MLKGRVFPSHLEARYRYHPWPNWALLAATAAIGTTVPLHLLPAGMVTRCFVLGPAAPLALLGHLFAPGTLAQLAGNLFFLWLLGHLLCRTLGSLSFLALYVALGTVSGLTQLAFGSTPVPGADGALAGLLGLGLAVGPTALATGHYPHRRGLRTFEIPVWALTLYWIVWGTLGWVLHLWRVPVWGECVGFATGLSLGLALPQTGLLPLNGAAGASLLDLCRRRRSPQPQPETADPRAELRRLAQVFLEEYSTMPPIPVDAWIDKRQQVAVADAAGAACARVPTTANAAPRPLAQRTSAPASTQASAWSAALPDARYFHFDGANRHGPETRAEFLACLSRSPDTSRWWYWAEGMREWRRVARLNKTEVRKSSPAPAPAGTPAPVNNDRPRR